MNSGSIGQVTTLPAASWTTPPPPMVDRFRWFCSQAWTNPRLTPASLPRAIDSDERSERGTTMFERTQPVICAGARTPIGRFGGALASLSAVQLGGLAVSAALERAGVAPDAV